MKNRLSTAQFKTKLRETQADRFTLLSEYINQKTKVKVRCNNCGYEWTSYPSSILRMHCPNCRQGDKRGKPKLSNEVFLQRLKAKYGAEYTPLEVYKGRFVPMLFRHNKCGHTIKMQPSSLLIGQGCKYCGIERSAKARKLSQYEFLKRLIKVQGDLYTPLEPYQGVRTKIAFKNNKTGEIKKMFPNSLIYAQPK